MNKKQIDAMAFMHFVRASNCDWADVIATLDDLYQDMDISQAEKEKIANRADEIHQRFNDKAIAKYRKAFPKND